MKKTILTMVAVLPMLVSCDITKLSCYEQEKNETEWGEVVFALDDDAAGIATKAASAAAETAVNSLQVLVYNSAGNLVSYGSSSSSSLSTSVPLNIGGHAVYAVVNAKQNLSSCSTTAQLTSQTSYLKDNSLSGLEMIGHVDDKTFTSGSTVTVDVKRFAAKVEIDEITSAFKADAHKAQEFKVTGVFLINVNGSCPYTQIPASGTWYNKMRYESGDCNALITDNLSSPAIVQTSSGSVTPHTAAHYFYCYANPTTVDTHGGSTFTPRRTRLVIETKLGTATYYYPIDIVGAGNILDVNTSYTVTKLTVTGPGVSNPDDELVNGAVSFTVRVTDWATGFSKTVTY